MEAELFATVIKCLCIWGVVFVLYVGIKAYIKIHKDAYGSMTYDAPEYHNDEWRE